MNTAWRTSLFLEWKAGEIMARAGGGCGRWRARWPVLGRRVVRCDGWLSSKSVAVFIGDRSFIPPIGGIRGEQGPFYPRIAAASACRNACCARNFMGVLLQNANVGRTIRHREGLCFNQRS